MWYNLPAPTPWGRLYNTSMEQIACPLCGAEHFRPVHALADWQHGLEGEFRLVHCQVCGVRYLNPRPDVVELAHYYPADYEPYRREALSDGPWWRRAARLYGLDKRCRAVTAFVSGGRLLDVGCASGDFLARMHRYGGWEVVGIEPDARAAALARECYGLSIHVGRLDEVEFPSACFDVVTLWDVLEHLPRPGASLERIARWLRPGGWLILRTPDASSPYARAWGRYWAGWDAPRHLVVYDRATLAEQLRQSGFRVWRVWTMSGSYALTALSWRYWLRAKGYPSACRSVLENPLSQAIGAPLCWLVDRLGGALLTVAAQTRERQDSI